MSRSVRLVLAICLTLVTLLASWRLWPRANAWHLSAPVTGQRVLVLLELPNAPIPAPTLSAPDQWHTLRLELTHPARFDSAGLELAQLLATVKPHGSELVLMARGVGGWVALEAALKGAPIDRLIVMSSSATATCGPRPDLEGLSPFFRWNVRDLELRDRLHSVHVPVLVLAGEKDPATRAHCPEEIVRNVPGARWETVPGAGDQVLTDAPEAASRLISDFLQ